MSAKPFSSRMRWVMIALAFSATAINYLDRQALSVAAPLICDHFHISNVQYSHILFCFLLSYTVMNGVSGSLIDKLGTRIGYALCMAWWSISAILHAFATGFYSLAAYRFLLGMGEAGNWPGAVKVVAEWFPAQDRAFAAGLFNSGSAAGAILAPPLIAFMILRHGWRSAFVVVGVLGLIWLLFWLLIYRSTSQPTLSAGLRRLSVRELLRKRFVWSFTISKMFLDPVWYFYIFWFPEYLSHARHFNMAAIGEYAWIPFGLAGLGNIFGGLLSRTLVARGISTTVSRKTAITITAAMMIAAVPAVLTPSATGSIAYVSIAMAGYTATTANMLALPCDVISSNAVASVYGIASMGSGFGGMLFTLFTGWLVDHYSYKPVFIFFGLIPLLSALILWTCMGPIHPVQKGPFLADSI